MTYTLNEAYTQLDQLVKGSYTKEHVLAPPKRGYIVAEGNVTVPYSGPVDGVCSSDIADSMRHDSNIRVLNKTAAAKLITSDEFKKALDATQGLSLGEMEDNSFMNPEKSVTRLVV